MTKTALYPMLLSTVCAFAFLLSTGVRAAERARIGGASTEEVAAQATGLLVVGAAAPDFTLKNALGEDVSLSSFKGKKQVVLYFYPKDNTPGCTRQAQGFRDEYEKFVKAGAEVLGVSVDDQRSHKNFAEKQKLNFSILSDAGGKVARQYGVMGWIMAKRATYVIGLDGNVKAVFPDVDVEKHAKEVLRAVRSL